jgi:hypothetical protein
VVYDGSRGVVYDSRGGVLSGGQKIGTDMAMSLRGRWSGGGGSYMSVYAFACVSCYMTIASTFVTECKELSRSIAAVGFAAEFVH